MSLVEELLSRYPVPKRDVEPGDELVISDEELRWAREKMSGCHHGDARFSSLAVAGYVRMLTRDDLHHETVCMMGRDRIARLVLEIHRLREENRSLKAGEPAA